jgi:hypothetical protein
MKNNIWFVIKNKYGIVANVIAGHGKVDVQTSR